MKLKRLVKYGLMALVFCGHTLAMDDGKIEEKLLVIGCRPWDENLRGFSGLDTAHFVDFMTHGGPEALPANFHHLDVNNNNVNSGRNFSEFAAGHIGQFNTVIVDWATWQHIRRNEAWSDFAKLLGAGGNLIVPVASMNFITGASLSQEKAEEMKGKISNLFNQIDMIDVFADKNIPEGKRFDLLRRPNLESGRLEAMLSMKPVILVATKQVGSK